jgi:hypothetical protein
MGGASCCLASWQRRNTVSLGSCGSQQRHHNFRLNGPGNQSDRAVLATLSALSGGFPRPRAMWMKTHYGLSSPSVAPISRDEQS